jgi:predicted transcriptional regulator
LANVKTAVSIEEPLFERAEELAREMNVSRSRLYEMALEDFIRQQESKKILRELDEVYAEEDVKESRLREMVRPTHRRLLEDEW